LCTSFHFQVFNRFIAYRDKKKLSVSLCVFVRRFSEKNKEGRGTHGYDADHLAAQS
jgi:hypothetical protein